MTAHDHSKSLTQTKAAAILTFLLLACTAFWICTGLYRATPPPGFYPIVSTVVLTGTLTATALALSIGLFLAFSRHRVLHDLGSWWIGIGLSALMVAVLFRFFSFPIGPSHPAVLDQPPSSAAWMFMWATTVFGSCLLAAHFDRRTLPDPRPLWPVAAWTIAQVLVFSGFIAFASRLPRLVLDGGRYTVGQLVWQSAIVLLLGAGAALAILPRTDNINTLLPPIGFSQIMLAFAHLWSVLGGSRYSLISVAAGMLIPGGYLLMVFGLLSDYLVLMRRERQLNDQLGQQIHDLKRTEAALRRSNGDLEQFAWVASHDLREPLRTMATYSSLLLRAYQRKELNIHADRCVEFITASAKRMDALISGLLDYSRVTAPYENSEQESVDLNRIFRDALNSLDTLILEAGAAISAADLPTVRGNAAQLQRVFQNLLENSLKYRRGDEPLKVDLGVANTGDEWLFHVRDNGMGFRQEYAEKIFGIFRRLFGADIPGTGMGLAICRAVIDRHGGKMWAEGEPARGATFYFTLPRTYSHADKQLSPV